MGKLRVFISSTMKDLVNERLAIERQLRQFNFEPVNAESWLPDGSKSWERINQELLSSHLFVLVIGLAIYAFWISLGGRPLIAEDHG